MQVYEKSKILVNTLSKRIILLNKEISSFTVTQSKFIFREWYKIKK